MNRKLELLAPARDASVGRIAILAGADAVYIGAPAFGARASAGNDVAEIAGLVAFAHQFRARIYVTMNTILFEDELEKARELVWELYRAGVDALIVQDMAYLMMDLPPIALHASTQCDIRTPEKAAMLAAAGFSQLVLPRELSLGQIQATAEAAGVPVEVFVHGALCVSYSGDCQAGCVAMGRSANRGVCPQMCRLPYRLTDAEGRDVGPEKHYLSLRDLNQCDRLPDLIKSGASSFKIEGRLKDARYVANVTAAYSRALDDYIRNYKGYERSSAGTAVCGFKPNLDNTFNRGYTHYFLDGRPSASVRMASIDTPKWAGAYVGKIISGFDSRSRSFAAALSVPLANGDGLGYFDADSRYVGFRLNRVENGKHQARLFSASDLKDLKPGTRLYRNNNKAFLDQLDCADAGCSRTLKVRFALRPIDKGYICVSAADERECRAEIAVQSEFQEAGKPQEETRIKTFSKLGGTIYAYDGLDDSLGNRFIPLSVLTQARRDVLAALDADAAATYSFERRKDSALASDAFAGLPPLTYHDNVANSLSRRFYESHGARIASEAIEVAPPEGDVVVMTTRYCIRRELGACLKEADVTRLPHPLFLCNPSGKYRLDFDCGRCGMTVVKMDDKAKKLE